MTLAGIAGLFFWLSSHFREAPVTSIAPHGWAGVGSDQRWTVRQIDLFVAGRAAGLRCVLT